MLFWLNPFWETLISYTVEDSLTSVSGVISCDPFGVSFHVNDPGTSAFGLVGVDGVPQSGTSAAYVNPRRYPYDASG